MLKASSAVLAIALGVTALAACKQESPALDVRAAMQQHINPATLAIWDVGNNAMNDQSGIDPALLDDAKWTKLGDAAGQLATAARELAGGSRFVASAADNAQVAEGEIAMAQVQKHLDADPAGFAKMAAGLADHADKLAVAAKAKDAAAAGELISGIDPACEGCHMKYWYPEAQ